MNKLIYTVLFFLTVHLSVTGQKMVPTPEDLYSDALEFMISYDYSDALSIFLTLENRGYSNANIDYKIGECYLNIPGQKTRAIPFLKGAADKMSVNYSGSTLDEAYAPFKTLLYLGIAYRLNYDFDNALLCFNNYLQRLDDTDTENRRLAEYHIERCNYARELIAAPARFHCDTLPDVINTSASNFNALVTADEKILVYMNQLKFYDAVMHSARLDTGWQVPENLTPLIKSDGDHYVTGMSADGKKLLLTSYDPYQSGEIFTTEFDNGSWSALHKLNNAVNTIFNETHASLSPDGQVLYFTSDRKGGYGGLDIYKSVKGVDGEWEKPSNLGPLINTQYNEESPFLTSDGTKLFFSSQGHYNMGGYDVFYSSLGNDGNWLPPVNIGYPLNTPDDDLFFFPLDSGDIAYQSRFLPSAAQMDIVRFTISAFGKPERFIVNGKMDIQAAPGFKASDVNVTFINKKVNDTLTVRPLHEDGSFRQKLAAGDYKLDFTEGSRLLLTRDLDIPEYFPHNNLVFQDKIVVPVTRLSDTLFLRNIRFAFNRSNISHEDRLSLEPLVKAMIKYPGITVQINGYADALGSDKYNLLLSQNRADSVAVYLKSEIATPERVTVNAFGEKNPVARNINEDGSDNPEGRSFNRRAEIIVTNAPEQLVIIIAKDIPEQLQLKQ